MKAIILTISVVFLLSCKKEQITPTEPTQPLCDCYDEEYILGVEGGQLGYYYNRDLAPYKDFCMYDGRMVENGNKRYVTVCN